MKKTPHLSPASFVTVHTPHKSSKQTSAQSILNELLIHDTPIGIYDAQVQGLRQRFNDMYYKFVTNLTSIHFKTPLSRTQQENLHSIFEELVEMRTMLDKDVISTR
jgi:hypothetical protein